MADRHSSEAASSSQSADETSDSCIELNIKTLDSHVHTFRVKRNISVQSFKEQIASAVDVPVLQQRLIFRGKVLKDDHLLSDYNIDEGHTLHLVVRQPDKSQPPAGTGPAATANDSINQQGSEPASGGFSNRVRQISHNVVLGTFNVGDQVENIVPEISRIISTVLSSVGVGNVSTNNVGSSNQFPNLMNNISDQVAEGRQRDGSQANGGGRGGNQAPPGPVSPNITLQSLPRSFQLLSGVASIPSQPLVIPDSLTTLSEFISRMEMVLSQIVIQNQPPSSSSLGGMQPSDSSSSPLRGLPTPESLSSVIHRVQRLLGGQAVSALSNIAGRLEGQSGVTDPMLRNQIQAEAAHVGIAMQHLGALLLELSRTILTLRMGRSPGESIVNSGPAVYISRHGPNPLMVQPFPFQASSLFSANSAIPVPVFAGPPGQVSPMDISRNVNIHIHAGTSLTPGSSLAGARAAGEVSHIATQNSEQLSANGTSPSGDTRDSGTAQILPMHTVVAAFPAHPAEATNTLLSLLHPIHGRPQQTTADQLIPAQGPMTTVGGGLGSGISNVPLQQLPQVTAQVQMHIGGLDSDVNSGSHPAGSTVASDLVRSTERPQVLAGSSLLSSDYWTSGQSSHIDADVTNSSDTNAKADGIEVPLTPASREQVTETPSRMQHSELPTVIESYDSDDTERRVGLITRTSMSSQEERANSSALETIQRKSDTESMQRSSSFVSQNASTSNQGEGCDKAAPLGLGLRGLQPLPSKKSRPVKQQSDGQTSNLTATRKNPDAISQGQSILQSLASQGRSGRFGRASGDANGSLQQFPSMLSQILGGMSSEGSAGSGHVDVTSMMSQVLCDPQLNSILSGISDQAGGASPDVLKNMMGQFVSSPSMQNLFQQVVQRVEDQDVERTISGLGSGQNVDFSRMIQQMLPVVTKALGGISIQPADPHDISSGPQSSVSDPLSQTMKNGLDELERQFDIQDAARQIESGSSGGAFRVMVANAVRLSGTESGDLGLLDELCADEGLASEFMQMLYRSLHQRLESERGTKDRS